MIIFNGFLTVINSFLIMLILWEKLRIKQPSALRKCIDRERKKARWENNPRNYGIPFDENEGRIFYYKLWPPKELWKFILRR